MLSVEADSVFFIPKSKKKAAEAAKKKFLSNEGDHFVLLNVYNAFVANDFKKEWCYENFINYRTLCKARVLLLLLQMKMSDLTIYFFCRMFEINCKIIVKNWKSLQLPVLLILKKFKELSFLVFS